MVFEFDFSDELKEKMAKLAKRDRQLAEIIRKKVKEIISSDAGAVERYKNLRYELKTHKRVHMRTHFVLVFRVFKKENFIFFEDFDHHDKVYK